MYVSSEVRIPFKPFFNHQWLNPISGACTIHGVAVADAPVSALIVCEVSRTDYPVAAHMGYHVIHAIIIRGVAATDTTAAARLGYHYCNYRVWSRHGKEY